MKPDMTIQDSPPSFADDKVVYVGSGPGGWGVGLFLQADPVKNKVVSLTGGGIHPVAQKIAQLLERPVVDAYVEKVSLEEMICVVVDCGGTARMGVYPMKKIPTINVKPASPSGPLAVHITEDLFVSGTTVNEVKSAEGSVAAQTNGTQLPAVRALADLPRESETALRQQEPFGPAMAASLFAKTAAYLMGWLYQCGKDSVTAFVTHVLPMMVGISVLLGAFEFFGLSSLLTATTRYSLGTLTGLILTVFIFSIPVISRFLGAGATLGQMLIVVLGYQIALGNISFIWMIPALFATNVQVGCDFLPTGLMMGKCEERTVQAGLKAVQYSRFFTGIFCVLVAYYIAVLMGF